VRRQGSPFHLAWSQLTRDRLRFAVAVAGVTFAVVLMLVQLGFRRALFRSSVRIQERLNGQVVLISPQSSYIVQMRSFPRRRLEQALATPGVAAVSPLYMSLAFWENPEGGLPRHIFLLGIDPEANVLDMPDVQAQSSLLKIRDVALFDSASRPEYGAVAERLARDGRAEVEVNDHRLEIRGVFRMGTSFGIDGTVITSDLDFLRVSRERPPGLVEIGLVRLAPGASPEAVRDAIASHVPNDVLVLTKEDYIRREIAYWTKVTPIGVIFGFGVMIGFGVGAIIVSQILFSDVSDHLPEYATLKAIGYGNLYLYGVVLSEAIILAVLGYLPGLLAALALYRAAAQATMLPMEMAPSMAALVLGLTVSMCSLAGILALRKLQRADPAEIF
jgi:putative ABC transport system permease protein